MRHNAALGLNNYVILDEKEEKDTYIVVQRDKEAETTDMKYFKLHNINGFYYSSSCEYFNTGIPDKIMMLLAVRKNIKVPVAARWAKNYDELLNEMEEKARHERVEALHE